MALTGPLQCMPNNMDNMMAMALELSQKVHGLEKEVAEKTGIPLARPTGPQLERKRARCQDSPAQNFNLNEMVCQRVEQRLRQVLLLKETTARRVAQSMRSRSHEGRERPSSQA